MADVINSIFNQDLEKGMKSDDVRRLQELLAMDPEVYPEALITGYYGDKTEEAVKRWQLKHGVIESLNDEGAGRVGPKTRKMLQQVFSTVATNNPEMPVESNGDLSNDGGQILLILQAKRGIPNPAKDEITKRLRKFIGHEFSFENDPNYEKTALQCTEYTHFRIKQKLGIVIPWTPKMRPRHGKYWGDYFPFSDTPKQNSAMSFTAGFKHPAAQATGHIAFVEEVYPNESIRISEANWDDKGSYIDDRVLTVEEYKNGWKGKFILFS